MKNLLTILCSAALVFAAMAPAGAQGTGSDGLGIFAQAGFGWANNLRTEDWNNARQDWVENPVYGTFNPGYTEESEKVSLIYGGFDIEPRLFAGNLVYGFSLGLHNTTSSQREVVGTQKLTSNPLTWHSEARLQVISLRANVYYNVNLSETSYVLLGGGLGYYHASLEIKDGYNNNLKSYDGSGWTIGWHAQIEYNKKIFSSVVMSGGIMTRFAEIWKLEVDDSSGNEVYDSGASLTGIYFYVGAGYMI